MIVESGAICDRFEWDLFTLGGPTCSPACVEDNGVCASEVLRSRDDTMVVIVKAGWDAVEKLARLDAVLM